MLLVNEMHLWVRTDPPLSATHQNALLHHHHVTVKNFSSFNGRVSYILGSSQNRINRVSAFSIPQAVYFTLSETVFQRLPVTFLRAGKKWRCPLMAPAFLHLNVHLLAGVTDHFTCVLEWQVLVVGSVRTQVSISVCKIRSTDF